MPKKYFVPGCKTGYLLNKRVEAEMPGKETPISIFKFPKNGTLRKQWLQTILWTLLDEVDDVRYQLLDQCWGVYGVQ